ncbi:thy-1 membrane glycoprotein [Amia ocellicauda]|uniref:thy-1 membrane glycoprotein n=1 Tax=Amia ocellicauda TaxID=2972642 RepID=UPI003463967B
MNSLFIFGVFAAVSVVPVLGQSIIVCQQEDKALRIDCLLQPKAHQITTYEFSLSKSGKETLINSNVTGITTDPKYKDKSRVMPLDPYGYRLTMPDFQLNENTTFICKIGSQHQNSGVIEKGKLVTCSAFSVCLHSCSWLLYALLSLPLIQNWGLSSL